jgi:hypothetical protein
VIEPRTTTRSKLTFEQEVNVILDRMVAEAKRADATRDLTKKNAIINSATTWREKGIPSMTYVIK